MFWKRKKIEVPVTNETQEIEVLETWVVSWVSIEAYSYSSLLRNGQVEFVVFIDEEQANNFKKSLEDAIVLLKDTPTRKITLEKR